MKTIGDIIREERKKHGWSQAELTKRLGGQLKQQAVSSWENGGRPQADLIPKIADVLGVDSAVLSEAAGYIQAKQQITPAVRPLLTTLPLGSLSPEQFEQFTADLAGILYPGAAVYRYGGSGHTQNGIDVAVERNGSLEAGFQCKRHKTFGKQMIQNAIADTTITAASYFIALTRVASPEARDEIAKHPLWELWDVEDISRLVRDRKKVPLESAIQLLDTYFPTWRGPFLGVEEPGPWVKSDVFFRPFTGDRLFSHDWRLVGRAAILDEVSSFLGEKEPLVGVLTGRGGVGKSRLLRAVAEQAENEIGFQVRFLSTTQEVKPVDFEKLPSDDKLLVIIDDAHDRGDVAEILAGINRVRPQAKIILAIRPYGLSSLAYALHRVGLHPSDLPTWRLEDLKQGDAESLAREVLGANASDALIQRLAFLTKDCPLITVVGAGLIKRGQLDPARLEGDESVRVEILRAFQDSLVVDSTQGDPRTMRALLNALAIMQPVHITKPVFQESLEKLTKATYDELLPYLRNLEDAGVLVRRGQSLRILPDLLGDVILARACFDDRSGIGTGYIERVHRELEGEALQHVVINASRVDWQVRRENSSAPSLVDSLWEAIDTEFKKSGINARLQIIKLLQKVSYYQPDRSLRLIRYAIDHPINEPEPIEGWPEKYWNTYEHVVREIPSALKHIAYNLDYLDAVANLLWELAKTDKRSTNQSEHPIRMLSDLAAFENGKPLVFHDAMITAAEKWLRDEDLVSLPYSPFDVLEKMLTTEGADNFAEGITISFRAYALNVKAVKALRDRIIDIALAEIGTKDTGRGVRALEAIQKSLSYPAGLFGRKVEDAERKQWTPLFVETIDKLAAVATNKNLDPVIAIALREALHWHLDYSKADTKQAAQKAVQKISTDVRHELALLLYDGWGHLLYNRAFEGGYEKAEQKKRDNFRSFAVKLTTGYDDDKVAALVEERLSVQRQTIKKNSHPGAFVWELLEVKPSVGVAICSRVEKNPDSSLVELLSIVISRLADKDPEQAMPLVERLRSMKLVGIDRAISNSFGWSRGWRDTFLEGEMELMLQLASHDDEFVRANMVQVATTIDRFDHAKAMEILAVLKIDGSAHVAQEFFSVFGPFGLEFDWDELPSAQQDAVWQYLKDCPALDDHHATSFLVKLADKDPDGVLTLLKHRVELSESGQAPADYDAFPYWHDEQLFGKHPQLPVLLRQIRDWMNEKPDSYYRAHDGADIFKLAAGGLGGKAVLAVLDEFVTSGEKNKVETVSDILRQASASFMWDNVDFVSRLLNSAAQHGEKCLRHVKSALYGAVISGSRSGTTGEPFPEDISQRDNAARIAASLTPGSIEEEFYRLLERQAVDNIRSHAEDDEKMMDGRDW